MSDDQFKDLKNYLDERFDAQDAKFEKRFDEQDTKFAAIDRRFEAIDRRFEAIDRRFEAIDRRFDEQDTKFRDRLDQGLAQTVGYVDKRFNEFETKLDAKADRKDLERIYDALDAILKNQEIEQQERVAIIAQLERHERWHHQTAEYFALKLT